MFFGWLTSALVAYRPAFALGPLLNGVVCDLRVSVRGGLEAVESDCILTDDLPIGGHDRDVTGWAVVASSLLLGWWSLSILRIASHG